MKKQGTRGRARSVLGCLLVLALAGLVVTGCGSSNKSDSSTGSSGGSSTTGGGSSTTGGGSSSIDNAKASAEAAQGAVKFTVPGPPIDVSSLKGKSVAYIPFNPDVPFSQTILSEGVRPALNAAGLKTVYVPTQSTPASWAQAVEQAVAQHVDAIILQSIPPSTIGQAIKAANAAHIPIVESLTTDIRVPLSPGAQANVSFDMKKVGTDLADYAIGQTGGKVDGVIFSSPDTQLSAPEAAAIQAEFKKVCPQTCKAKVENVTVAQWATQLPLLTKNALASDPNVNWLFPLFDGEVPYVLPALTQAGSSSKTKIASFNATPGVMKYMTQGDILAADVGNPFGWTGYQLVDQALRLMLGKKPASPLRETPPLRLFTQSNFTANLLNQPDTAWYGGVDYAAEYAKLWGLKK
jgi:ribose transport system substrate-binding protein